jgi:6-bladed beta-propeller
MGKLIGVAALGALCACRSTSSNSARLSLRDSAGIEIVESSPPPKEGIAAWMIDSIPLFDVGADPSEPNLQFSYPSNPVCLSDGRIAIADPGSQQIRFFDSGGAWLRNVGRKGEGPGEFTDLGRLFLGPGDSLYADEVASGFVSVFDSAGRFARRVRLQSPGEHRSPSFSGVLEDGTWMVDGRVEPFPPPPGLLRIREVLLSYSADGMVRDSLLGVPGRELYLELVGQHGIRSLRYVPLLRSFVLAVWRNRVVAGVTERVDLQVYRSGKGVERIIRIRLPGQSVTRILLERDVDRRMADQGLGSDARSGELRRTALDAPHPELVPAIDTLVIAANGDLWLREYVVTPEQPSRWVVTDSTGRFKAFALGPARFAPSWIGADRAIGLWKDGDDVVHLRAYRLRQ